MKPWIKIIFKKIKNNKVKEKTLKRVLEDADLLNFYSAICNSRYGLSCTTLDGQGVTLGDRFSQGVSQ